ncbi:MAG: hypothetical protein BWY78_01298 [Alphaproteobacteria bacterium ADurb.Bin438]|nr:MAG: hypothetical protein BWY78_01298 [Alphaproteobacteria bacterium ADurb.Bin438]
MDWFDKFVGVGKEYLSYDLASQQAQLQIELQKQQSQQSALLESQKASQEKEQSNKDLILGIVAVSAVVVLGVILIKAVK